jgi:hypothetical protein
MTDFLDITASATERTVLSCIGADDKFSTNNIAMAARGYSLWRVLRRMEMENVDTQNLTWLTYAMHIERGQATLSMISRYAPITSVLSHTHMPTVLSQVRICCVRSTQPLYLTFASDPSYCASLDEYAAKKPKRQVALAKHLPPPPPPLSPALCIGSHKPHQQPPCRCLIGRRKGMT